MKIGSLIAGFLAIALLGTVCAFPAVSAANPEWVRLYSTGRATTSEYKFDIYNPGYFTLEDDYLNVTIKSTPMVVGAGTEEDWYVHLFINDGVTNKTWNKTLAVVNDAVVYSNMSLAAPGDYFVTNPLATFYVQLWYLNTTPTPDDFQKTDEYVTTISIYATQVGGVITNLIPTIIVLGIMVIAVKMLGKSTKKS